MIDDNELTCTTRWSISHQGIQHERIWLAVFRHRFFSGEARVATLIIPISWLPTDQVVKMWFPMKFSQQSWTTDIYALLKIHVDSLRAQQFQAPRGQLRVTPTWALPQNCVARQCQENKQSNAVPFPNPQQLAAQFGRPQSPQQCQPYQTLATPQQVLVCPVSPQFPQQGHVQPLLQQMPPEYMYPDQTAPQPHSPPHRQIHLQRYPNPQYIPPEYVYRDQIPILHQNFTAQARAPPHINPNLRQNPQPHPCARQGCPGPEFCHTHAQAPQQFPVTGYPVRAQKGQPAQYPAIEITAVSVYGAIDANQGVIPFYPPLEIREDSDTVPSIR
jgi:hypothetical protein